MSNISMDDLYHPRPTPKKRPRRGLKIGIAATIVVLILCCVWPKPQTVEAYREDVMEEVNKELAEPSSKLRKYIEDAHLTVTVKSVEIIRCDVTTLDGSDSVGKDESNIDKVSMLLRFKWDGIFQRNGVTDFRYVYDGQNKRPVEQRIEYTTAFFNTEDAEFWAGLGTLIALFI